MLASYWHGAGDMLDGKPDKRWFETKGVAVAFVAIAGLVAWFPYGVALAGVWYLFRRGKQAQMELDFMDRWLTASLSRIIKAFALPYAITQSVIGGLAGYNGLWLEYAITSAITLALLGVAVCASLYFRVPKDRAKRKESKRRKLRAGVEVLGLSGLGAGFQLAAIAYMAGGM
jgi:prepilin signal peptidase PulO-like enzyme (type II secretory pathway)